MRKIGVYGSLKAGFGNHKLIDNDTTKLLVKERLNIPYELISLGSFPGLIPSKEKNWITFEIYEVDQPTYTRVEHLEGYPDFYQKDTAYSTVGEIEFYVLKDERYFNKEVIKSGNWTKD